MTQSGNTVGGNTMGANTTGANTTRRTVLGGLAGGAAGLALSGRARAQAPSSSPAPASPVAVNVVDVAGNLALTQPAFEEYRRNNPKMVSRISFTQATAPELPAKLRAEQQANRVDIDLVITGTDALAAGIQQGIYQAMLPAHASALPDLQKILLPAAWRMQSLAQDQGVVVTYYPSGPLLEYNPDAVKAVPDSADSLLAYARQNKGRFLYARPSNSGPGRTFLMGMPYILGDKDPKDPVHGWDKTWAFLAALGETIEYYPSGTGAVMKELGEGSRDMTVSTTGWDINPRVLGVVPKDFKIATMKGFHFVGDAHYLCIPKGVAAEKVPVLLDLISFLLSRPAQAYTYDKGYFYPGPAVADVPISMAPQASQDAIKEYGRPEYDKLIADTPVELPLGAEQLVAAFRRWDEQIGAKAGK